ncbi:MAG: winged helix-turn-helix domain-containing protein [Pseudomonadota bacterium]
MERGPNIAWIAGLIGDPARAAMLNALMNGAAMTATELALEAGVTKQTASSHLAKLSDGALVAVEKQGRHHYYRLADAEVAAAIESLMGVAARHAPRVRVGPKDPALRHARVCYDHLAGDLGVAVFDALKAQKLIAAKSDELGLTAKGEAFFTAFGVEFSALGARKRPLCRACLDWSARRHHLAGGLGAALLDRLYALSWARRRRSSRIVEFTPTGEARLRQAFRLTALKP